MNIERALESLVQDSKAAEKEVRDAAREKRKNMEDAVGIIYDLATFQQKVRDGEISDDTGMAELLINGTKSNYHIHINRRFITKGDGSLITHVGLLKMYKPEELSVLYKKRSKKMMSIKQYKQMMRQRDKAQGRKSFI